MAEERSSLDERLEHEDDTGERLSAPWIAAKKRMRPTDLLAVVRTFFKDHLASGDRDPHRGNGG